jgi:hypothetical protein
MQTAGEVSDQFPYVALLARGLFKNLSNAHARVPIGIGHEMSFQLTGSSSHVGAATSNLERDKPEFENVEYAGLSQAN